MQSLLFAFFVLVVGIQLYFYLHFFLKLANYQETKAGATDAKKVSVIICAKNEEKPLVNNLPGFLMQDYPADKQEIVVVNDNSEDRTGFVLEEMKEIFPQLNPVTLKQKGKLIIGKKFPLSIGIKSSNNNYLLLSDADCVPATEFWMDRMQAKFNEKTEVILGYGAYKKKPGFLNQVIRFETVHTALQYFSFALAGKPYMGVGRNLAYTQSLFFKYKGFSSINHIPGGDDDLFINKVANKYNTAIVLDKKAFTLSEPEKSWKNWKAQKNRHYTTAKYYRNDIKLLLGAYQMSQFWVYPLVFALLFTKFFAFALLLYVARTFLLAFVWKKVMEKLDEKDLWTRFLLWDFGLFIYDLYFIPSLWKKPAKTWRED